VKAVTLQNMLVIKFRRGGHSQSLLLDIIVHIEWHRQKPGSFTPLFLEIPFTPIPSSVDYTWYSAGLCSAVAVLHHYAYIYIRKLLSKPLCCLLCRWLCIHISEGSRGLITRITKYSTYSYHSADELLRTNTSATTRYAWSRLTHID